MKKYNEQWDSHYDDEKDIWLEKPCKDKGCEFCNNRPNKPSECLGKEDHSPESTRGEKLDEMPDYETPNVVVDSEVSVSSPTVVINNPSGQLSKNKIKRRKDKKWEKEK